MYLLQAAWWPGADPTRETARCREVDAWLADLSGSLACSKWLAFLLQASGSSLGQSLGQQQEGSITESSQHALAREACFTGKPCGAGMLALSKQGHQNRAP